MADENWVCINFECAAHEHPGHPLEGHCEGCLDEAYADSPEPDSEYTFKDSKVKCCCRDKREAA